MKNLYLELKNRQQKEVNAFPLGACFSKEQFADMMQKWGLTVDDTDKIVPVGGGCYVRKNDLPAFLQLNCREGANAAVFTLKGKNGFRP